mmetsp:Transcript_5857/g.12335  ORF Transcript_5857/g.12335 Transcript_5857/m.12335 type:complete len:85 (-) Transcript_5857:340-594(-)
MPYSRGPGMLLATEGWEWKKIRTRDYSGITAPGNSDRVILGTTRTPTTLWRNASTRESSTKVEKNQLDFTIEAIYPFPIKSNRG